MASTVVFGCHNSSCSSWLYSRVARRRTTPCWQASRTMNTSVGLSRFRNSVPLGASILIQANGSLSQLSVAWQKHNSCHAADSSCKPCAFVLGHKCFPLVQAFSTFFFVQKSWVCPLEPRICSRAADISFGHKQVHRLRLKLLAAYRMSR